MLKTLLIRLATGLPTLLVLLTLTFFLMRLAPGGPFDRERSLPPETEAVLRAEYQLDQPLWQQYQHYLRGVLHGDFGPSFQYPGTRVSTLIAKGAPVSATIGALALALALLLGAGAGGLAALYQGRWPDALLSTGALLGLSLPAYVVAPLLVWGFAVTLHWLPAGGWQAGRPLDVLLPVLALALPQTAAIARLVRGSLLDVLQAPYIRTARAKGLPMHRVLLRHALKPASLPLLSYLGPAAAGVLTGSVVVEQVFDLPGIGRYFVQGALNRDYTLVLGVVALYGALIVLFNALVDVLYRRIDPRLA